MHTDLEIDNSTIFANNLGRNLGGSVISNTDDPKVF